MTRPNACRFLRLIVFGLVGTAGCGPSYSASLVNQDARTVEITIIKGASRTNETIAAGGHRENLCPNGCIVRIDKDPKRDFILEGDERVSIESGLLYYDGELVPDATRKGAATGRGKAKP